MKDREIRTLGTAVILGKVVAWGACLLVTVLLGCWLFMAKSSLRDLLVQGCAVVLAALALSAWVLRRVSGNPERLLVYRAMAYRASTLREGNTRTLPGRLRGASTLVNGELLKLYGGAMALLLPLGLGMGIFTPTGKAAEIVSAGAVVRVLQVETVRDVVRDRHNNGSTYFCTVAVTLPSADGSGRGSGTRAKFRSEWSDPAVVGANVYVAYAPNRPDLGAVGDDDRAHVERELSGRAMTNWWTWMLALVWLALIGILSVGYPLNRRDQRFPRRLRGDAYVRRASISGYDGHGEGKARISLATSSGPMQLHVHVNSARYLETVGAAEGHLVWVPDSNRLGGRKGPNRTGAVFIADAGWFIPGGLAPEYEKSARAVADRHIPVDSTGESRLLDLDGGWLLSIPNRLMHVLLLWTLCVVVLALPIPSASWRPVVGMVGMVGLLVYGLYAVGSQDRVVRGQSGSSRGAVRSAP